MKHSSAAILRTCRRTAKPNSAAFPVRCASIIKSRSSEPLQRDGDVRLKVCREKQITREVLHSFIKSKLADETELIATDENNQYAGIADGNTKHETVSHTQKEWVRGVVHTNGLEGVWSYSSAQSLAATTKSLSNIWIVIWMNSNSDSTIVKTHSSLLRLHEPRIQEPHIR